MNFGSIAALVGAGASSFLSNIYNFSSNMASSAMAAKEAEKTRAMQWQMWQEQKDLALNAHKYEVDDLRRAGLNPILSATGGNGISVPSGSVSATPGGLDFSGMKNPVEKAFEVLAALQRLELTQKQIEGVSSANEGKKLENDARAFNNFYTKAVAKFRMDKEAYGTQIAEQNLKKSRAEANILHEDSVYRGSVEGRRLHSAKQYQMAYPRNGVIGSLYNITGAGVERILNAIEEKAKQKHGPERWNEAWKDIR